MFYSTLKSKASAFILVLFLAITITGCWSKKAPSEVFPSEEERLTATIIYSNKDSVYSPLDESITYDKTENMFYYDNVLIVYLVSELSDEQANELAVSVDGIVVGKINGNLNVLQIMVKSNNLSGLENLASKLMENENVLYASYDFPMPLSISASDNNPWDGTGTIISDKNNEDNPDGNDWWAEAIGSYTAWELVDEYEGNLTGTRVGIIDSGFDIDHEDLIRKITFLNDYPANTEDGHGTAVAAFIAANNNTVGLRGVSDASELICVDWSPTTNDTESREYVNLLSTGEYLEIIKSMLEHDVKVINCSWGIHFMSEDGYAKDLRNDVAFGWLISLDRVKEIMQEELTYKTYCAYIQALARRTGMECFALLTGLIGGGEEDFLIVQAAGNGFDNGGVGYDTKYNGFFCSMTEETYNLLSVETRKRMEKLGCSYDNLREHTIIVGAVKNSRDTNGNYQMCEFSNFGTMVDICAPGYAVFTAALDNGYQWDESSSGTSYAAPMVSGAAALVWSFAPELAASEVKDTLVKGVSLNAIGVGSGNGTKYPMLNVGNATKAVAPKLTVVNIEFDATDWGNYAIITAYDENDDVVWIFETPQYEPTELPRVSEIGEKEDKYYFIQDRTVIALDIQTGTIVWENNDFGGSGTGVALGENAIYLCGQYGPDFYAISYDGNTLVRIEQLDPNYYWASEIELLDRQAAIYLHGGTEDYNSPKVFYIDLETYDVSTEINIDSSEPWKNAYVQLIGVLNHILGDWTDGSTEYRIFADEKFERNIAHISAGKVISRSNIESGVVEVTGEYTANLAPYVQSGSLQTWMELKYDPTTDTIYVGNDTHPYYRMSDWVSGNTPDVTYTKPNGGNQEEKKYGDNVTWTLSDGVLRASGVGKMENYVSTSYVPWYEERAKVTSVIMEGTITSVGSYAFDGFGKMTSITLPDTIKSVEEFAFWRCDALPSITIPNGCTMIGNSAFNWCESLEVITLPATISEIQWNAFAHCENLSDIYFAGTMEQWQSINISRTGNEELLSATVHYNSSGPSN